MAAIRTLIATSLLSTLPIGAAIAQTDQASTEAGALSAEKAPNTTAVGQTKPPSRDASPTSIESIGRPTPDQVSNDAIAATVCVGCGTGSSTTDPLSLRISPSVAPKTHDNQLNAPIGQRDAGIATAAPPKQQSDLNTVALASAHRERAQSVEEKTTGLWQSWLVSVCDGCGDQKPAKSLKVDEWPNRAGPVTTGSITRTVRPVAARPEAKPAPPHPRGSLEADLSPENVDSIRRMPQP